MGVGGEATARQAQPSATARGHLLQGEARTPAQHLARWLSTRPRAVQVAGGGWDRPAGGAPISRQTQHHVLRLLLVDPASTRAPLAVAGQLAPAIDCAGWLLRQAASAAEGSRPAESSACTMAAARIR